MSAGPGPAELIGSPRLHLRRTDSTNDRARALASTGAPHGTLVTASEQTAGRGRQGRRWSAPAGSALLMSLLLRSPPPLLPLIAALAVELHDSAATLGLERADIEPALARLLGALALRLREPSEATLAAWRERDALRGRAVQWSGGSGRAEGIDGAGRLVVELAGGGHTTLQAGEVHLKVG